MADPSKKCIACGWTLEEQNCCSYESHFKLFYGAGNRGTWSIGSDVIMKERPDEGPKIEVKTLKYLENHPGIHAPKLIMDWVDSDGRYFVLQKRMPGQTLEKAWPSLSDAQRKAIADQVVDVRNQLRSLTSPAIQAVNQEPCRPGLLFSDTKPRGPFNSSAELWESFCASLPDFPDCEPYILTHCDLNLGNIMVQDAALTGILDWEYAGFYPIWYEYVLASWGWTEDDASWKKLLQERLRFHDDGHDDAKSFWQDLRALRKHPHLDEKGREVLQRLSAE